VINDGEESGYNMEMDINLGEYGASTLAVPICSRMRFILSPCICVIFVI
jgi:hypothetical protein